jgi:hypothetical protein
LKSGDTFTWFGGSGSVSAAGNWSPSGGPPTAGDIAIINTGTAVAVDAQFTANTIVLGGGTIAFDNDTGSLSGSSIDSNSVIALTGGGVASAQVIMTGGFANDGTIVADGAAGSTLTIAIPGSPSLPGDFINDGLIAADAGNGVTLSVGSGSELYNSGSVFVAVALGGGSVTNASGGRIEADGSLKAAVEFTGGLGTVSNHGSIYGTDVGIDLGAGGSIVNGATAVVSGGYFGIVAGAAATVSNSGTVIGGRFEGVTGTSAVVINESGALIAGGPDGPAVDLGGGTVVDYGTISGASGTAVYFGASGGDRLVLEPGYALAGGVTANASAGATNVLELASGGAGGTVGGLGTHIANFATVTVDPGAAWSLTGFNTIGGGVTGSNAGAPTDTGTLTDYGTLGGGVTIQGGGQAVVETGGIASGVTIDSGGNVVVQSAGTIDSPVIAGGVLTLEAGDVVSGGVDFASGTSGALVIAGTILPGPATLISGFAPGDTIELPDIGFSRISGSPSSGVAAGVMSLSFDVSGGQTDNLYFPAPARPGDDLFILSGDPSIGGTDITLAELVNDNPLAVAVGSSAAIDDRLLEFDAPGNAPGQLTFSVTPPPQDGRLVLGGPPTSSFTQADIDSGALAYQETVSGVSSDSFTFSVRDAQGQTLSGLQFQITITTPLGPNFGSTSAGVVRFNPPLQNPATIVAGAYVTNTTAADTGDAVYGTSATAWTLTNDGTVAATSAGAVGIQFAAGGTVVNAGTIIGSGDAVDFGAAGRLVADPGAVFSGLVTGHGGALELAAGAATGTLGGLGAGIINFATLTVDPAAVWSLAGAVATTTASNAGTVEDAGGLSFAGSLVNNGRIYIEGGAMLGLDGTVTGGGGSADFAAPGGRLAVGAAIMVNPVAGFVPGNAIDLTGFVYSPGVAASYSSVTSLLTVSGGEHSPQSLTLYRIAPGTRFRVAGDGHNGTLVEA